MAHVFLLYVKSCILTFKYFIIVNGGLTLLAVHILMEPLQSCRVMSIVATIRADQTIVKHIFSSSFKITHTRWL
jgi:hypothetical protein